MSWKGITIGGCLGSVFGGGPLGMLIGAALGNAIEKFMTKGAQGPSSARLSTDGGALVFCASAAAMLAKLAKADGHVTQVEIAAVERAFARLGFSAGARRYAVQVFRRAKDDSHTIYEYAREFAGAVASVEVRELFYEMLWDLARADGVVSAEEREILRRIPRALGIGDAWFAYYDRPAGRPAEPTPDEDYALLGVAASSDAETLKRAYREKAKKWHPDALRAQGLPEEMIGRATEQMSRLNAAWSRIRAARGI